MSGSDLSLPSNNFEAWSDNLQSIIINHQNKSGLAYLDAVLLDLARILQTEHVFVGVTTDDSHSRVKTLSYCAHQKIAPNFEYDLACTPCENVIGKHICTYTSDLADKFPDDQIITDLSLKAYIGVPLFDIEGNTHGIVVVCYCREIEDTKLAELLVTLISNKVSNETYKIQFKTSLVNSQIQFEELFDNSNHALLIQDLSKALEIIQTLKQPISDALKENDKLLDQLISSIITFEANHACLTLFGCDNKEQLSTKLITILSNDFKDFYQSLFIKAQHKVMKDMSSLCLHSSKGDNKIIDAHWVIPQTYEGTWQKVFISITDITQKSELEQQLRQSEKMRAIGQLAGGIAHDFNNMLAGIIGSADLLMLKKDQFDERSQHFLDIIINASERASELTSNLLSFSRKSNVTITPVDLHQTIQGTVAIIQRTISSQIQISLKLEADNFIISGDHSKLQSAIMNFLINSSQAIDAKGKISIKTTDTILDKEYCDQSIFDINPGPHISISISDDGCGISPQNIDKIFEPFFTTKDVGKGTGLGLSAAFGTIQSHKGSIYTYSELGKGTNFRIFLPSDVQKSLHKPREIQLHIGKGQTILLADDESFIRDTTQESLTSMGYKVIIAKDGAEAVELYKALKDSIDLVILDLNMPIMNGMEAFDRIKGINDQAKVIISSGLIDDNLLNKLQKNGLLGAIYKPFRIHELNQILSKYLG
ncbi:MAG: response regulator [Candidatus Cloacimonetes bacterium]|nr:response regulator [Candidatus Cloacimonadota bacterium]